jgi:hypothetical protein
MPWNSTCRIPPLSASDIFRFWEKVEKRPDGHWIWKRSFHAGYGQFSIKHRRFSAHRISFYLANGIDPERSLVLHKRGCLERACVNPQHLYLGDYVKNAEDAIAQNRHRYITHKGEDSGSAKLTEKQVMEIRNYPDGLQVWLGEKYGVSQAHISKIRLRQVWKHLPMS